MRHPAHSDRPPRLSRRLAILVIVGLVIWGATYLLPLWSASERFHAVLPLLWLADYGLFRRLSRRWWIILAVVALAMLALVWDLFSWQARAIGGRLPASEPLWYLSFLAGLMALYDGFRRGLAWLMPSAWRGTWRLTMLEAALVLTLFIPYAYTACSIHRPKAKVTNATDPEQAEGLPFEEIRFRAADDGVPLSGWFIPGRPGAPAVLICHGIGSNKGNFLSYVPFLHRAGFSVFLFDFRAHGDSGGHTISYGYYEARDVRGAVAYLRGRSDVQGIVAYGLSMGGSALLHAIPSLPDVRGVVVDSTFADLATITAGQLSALSAPMKTVILAEVTFYVRLELGVPLSDISPRRHIATVSPRPLLLIHGIEDRLVPVSEARRNFAAARPPKQLWLVPGAVHLGAHWKVRHDYERRVVDFLRSACEQPQNAHGV